MNCYNLSFGKTTGKGKIAQCDDNILCNLDVVDVPTVDSSPDMLRQQSNPESVCATRGKSLARRERRAFHTLDGLRGVAALLVVTRHANLLAINISFPETFLAVDLFFLLSGFVIAYAYDDRLANGNFARRFLVIRLVRLYPLYLLGLSIGLLQRIGSVAIHLQGWNAHRVIVAAVLGLFYASSALDEPTWTLLPELVANMIYAVFFRWLSRPVLCVLVAAGAAGVILCRLSYGTLDAGWALHQWPVIASRLTFSFFGGVLLFKSIKDHRQTHPLMASLCVLVITAALTITPPEYMKAAYEIVLVLVVFPIVVWTACRNEPGETAGRLFRFLGLVSYAIYVLHEPAAALFTTMLIHGLHLNLAHPLVANVALVVFMALLMLGTWLVDRYYDAPIRKALSRRLDLIRHTALR